MKAYWMCVPISFFWEDIMESSVVAKYLEEVKKRTEKFEANNKIYGKKEERVLVAYRGEPRDYGITKLTPSIFRDSSYVYKEKHLFELLEDYNVIEKNKNRNSEKMIDAQHYVSISRALDITFNVLVALYFACVGGEDLDGYVYVFCFPKYISPHSSEIEKLYEAIINGDDNKILDKNYEVITHAKNNDRITAQSGGFIFFPGKKACKINEVYYESVCINSKDKKEIISELNLFFGINQAKLFPEKQFVAEMVKDKYAYEAFNLKKKSFVERQLDEFFDRLDYELEIFCKKNDKKQDLEDHLKRIIRKEKSDIYSYIDRACTDEEYENMKNYVDLMFENLRRSKS